MSRARRINWFKVNGYRAPGLGGGYCCVMLPEKWTPGLKAHVEWEVDINPSTFRGTTTGTDVFREAYAKHEASYQKHSCGSGYPSIW